jgi:hypothetical protein
MNNVKPDVPPQEHGSLAMSGAARATLLVLLLVAVIVRFLHWPALHELRDTDELTYSQGSLQLLEGNLPGIHYAPAGPQTWVGCLYEAMISLKHLAFPDSVEHEAPLQLRPYLAIDHTVFDAYRDSGPLRQVWVIVSFICAIGGVIAGCRLGLAKAGIPGTIFFGGTIALLPLFVDFSVQARPYNAAWCLGVMALYYALASPRPMASTISAILMGLAIGSRIDMILLLPVVWSELWRRNRWQDRLCGIFRYHRVLMITFVIVAPWYLMTFVACLRAVASIRGSATGLEVTKPLVVFFQVMWEQGMLLHVTLFLVAIGLWIFGRPRRWLFAIYILLAGLSVFKGSAFGLRYQGAPLILAVLAGVYGIEVLRSRSSIVALGLSLAALVLPAAQTVRLVMTGWHQYAPDVSTQWVEKHVPPGTIIYLRPALYNLLPTPEAADATWAEVTDNSAYQRKFKASLQRFKLQADVVPRAMSEVNLALERGDRRFLFILGSHQWINVPRYDIRIFQYGPVFGVRDVATAFKQTGGVVILRGPVEDPLILALGNPTVTWLGQSGEGTRIYCSPDVAGKLK